MPRPVEGVVAPGFERVAEAFARNFAERREAGAAFVAYVDRALVVITVLDPSA